MLRRSKYNLNSLAHDATIQLIRDALGRGINLKRVFIDTVGPPASYQKKLEGLFPGIQITVAKKADSLYPIVSAASICAKVTRDAHLSRWVFAESKLQNSMSSVYGSGWLKESLDQVFGYPGIIRFSWSTCARILLEQAVVVVWADDEDAPNNASLVKYFSQAKASSAAAAAAGSDNQR
ncbi:ribonuclease H-like domain-containing protein, partial [Kickxella alabastrina]|uniref:ribonuclease H-like domain-containing protein n=1 Tax=Kickxella alabastrina TaxID=61397 RepID=UPI00221FAD99